MKFFGLLIALLLLSCTGQEEGSSRLDHVNDKKNLCEYSKWLKIEEVEGGALIEILHPTDKKKNIVIGINSNKKVHLELSSGQPLGVFSTTHIGMLAELNALESIKATTEKQIIYNEFIKDKIINNEIKSYSSNSTPGLESIVQSGVQVIVHSALEQFPGQSKLKKFKIETIPNYDWMESHPLGKAEWLLFFGYLTGKQQLAKERIKFIKEQYKEQQQKIRQIDSQILMGNLMGDFWIAPSGESFNAQFIKDAGGNYLFAKEKGKGSLKLSMEKVIMSSNDAEIWINPGLKNKELIVQSNPKVKLMNVFNKGKLYCYSSNSNKFWELGPIQPHVILEDLMRIIQQKDLENLYFYKEVI